MLTPLFNPRRDRWGEHFALAEGAVVAQTACARATIALLRLNEPDGVEERRMLQLAGILQT